MVQIGTANKSFAKDKNKYKITDVGREVKDR